jgi:hypothetical protein
MMDPRVKPRGRRVEPPKKKKSRLSAGPFLLSLLSFRLTIAALARIAVLALTILTLTVRILLLLARLLAAALLLAGLLTRVLILLTRVLILVRHRDLPC